jgi:hypothetical protein
MTKPYFFEKLNIIYPIEDILKDYNYLKKNLPPAIREIDNRQFGWILQSQTGHYKDAFDNLLDKYGNKSREYDCNKKTEACIGIFDKIIDDFSPCFRAGIRVYNYQANLNWRCDSGVDGRFFWRYHIPIIPTNLNILSIVDKDFILDEAGRVYRFASWLPHRVINKDSVVLRSHLVFTVPATSEEVKDVNESVPEHLNIQMFCGKGTIKYNETVFPRNYN